MMGISSSRFVKLWFDDVNPELTAWHISTISHLNLLRLNCYTVVRRFTLIDFGDPVTIENFIDDGIELCECRKIAF